MKYNHKEIEKKWQNAWEKERIYQASAASKKPKKYILIEFPYPSGEGLHMGHLRPYTAGDTYSRYWRMKGFEVLYPIGWDAFGLPAENFAIKNKVHPRISTAKNIDNAKRQLKSWGMGFDWSREVNTTDPNYYKWTQWIFLQFFKAGLAYEATGLINWCPVDKTGLANEEVIDGQCERCGALVEKKELRQWYLKITAYAEKLLEGLKSLKDWPEPVKLQQKNWIGRSEGVMYKQKVKDLGIEIESYDSVPQTFLAQTFCVIAPEHPLVKKLTEGTEYEKPVKAFVEKFHRTRRGFETENEIEGIFTGRYVDNPFGTGDLPIWIATFVVVDYGTGIVNASAHDERDFAFAKKYGIPLRPVMFPANSVEAEKVRNLEVCYHHDPEGVLQEPKEFKGRKWGEVREDIIAYIEKKGFGYRKVNYKLRDWVFSRQRYWGEPIPLIHCENCKTKKALLIHGFQNHGEHSWFPWLKNKLQRKGLEVFNPTMTTSHHPSLDDWIEELKPYLDQLGPNDLIIGHSLGSKAALHLLEKTKKKIGRLYLVASAIGEMHERDWDLYRREWKGADVDSLKKFWEKEIDLEKVDKHTSGVSLVLSKDDPWIKRKTHENLPKEWDFKLWDGLGHFSNPEIPELFELIQAGINTGIVPVPEKDLPVKLPEVKKYEPTGTGESPLAVIDEWVNVKCPNCDGPAKRETNTMPQWAGSSWYWLRYTDPKNDKEFASKKLLKRWTPVDVYFGGMEHTTLHLLYARFWNLFLYDQGHVTAKEPYVKRVPHGIVLGPDGEKMSKSQGNVVNPDEIIEKFGADALRMYEMFLGPHGDTVAWNDQGIIGVVRFLSRVYEFGQNYKNAIHPDSDAKIHGLIKKVTIDIESFKFNTAIAAFMEYYNDLHISQRDFRTFLILLAPFAPHTTEEIWHEILKETDSIHKQLWPKFNEELLKKESVVYVVQVNGKVRASINLPARLDQEEVSNRAKRDLNVKKHLEGKKPVKEIFVPDKLINFVIK